MVPAGWLAMGLSVRVPLKKQESDAKVIAVLRWHLVDGGRSL